MRIRNEECGFYKDAGLKEPPEIKGFPLCPPAHKASSSSVHRSNHGYRKAARGALPSLSFLDSFPVSQAEVPADQHSSAKEGMASKADVSGRPLESTENSRSPPGAWEPLDDPFAPSLKEMEAFKRRMGIHPDVDPFGRPSTASRDSGGGPERSRTETETGTDGKAKASEADGGMHRLRKVEEFDEGTRGGSKTAVSGGEHRTEAGSGTEPESAAARARQRHVTRVEAALADMGERVSLMCRLDYLTKQLVQLILLCVCPLPLCFRAVESSCRGSTNTKKSHSMRYLTCSYMIRLES